jgi:hypothetical protein
MAESELRSVLEHIALIHPEVVHSALRHQMSCDGDDLHSVVTVPASNTSAGAESPPPNTNKAFLKSHPSKMRTRDQDKTALPPPTKNAISKRHEERFSDSSTYHRSNEFQPPNPPRRRLTPPRSSSAFFSKR